MIRPRRHALLARARSGRRLDRAAGCSASATSRTTGSASSRSCGRSQGSLEEGRHHRAQRARPASRPRSCAAASTFSTSRGSTASTASRWSSSRRAKIGYVYARDGEPLPPTQTLGRIVACNHFQDAAAFLTSGGQRGRQRAILREGVYAINLALFVVITEDGVLSGPVSEARGALRRLAARSSRRPAGFAPVVIGARRPEPRRRRTEREDAEPHARTTRSASSPCTTARRSSPARSSRPRSGRGAEAARPQLLPGPRGLPRARRPARQAAAGADRRHLLHQPLVRDGRDDAEDPDPDRLRRRRGRAYYGGHGEDVTGAAFRYGEQVERGRARRLEARAAARQVPAQPVRAAGSSWCRR